MSKLFRIALGKVNKGMNECGLAYISFSGKSDESCSDFARAVSTIRRSSLEITIDACQFNLCRLVVHDCSVSQRKISKFAVVVVVAVVKALKPHNRYTRDQARL